MEYEIKPYIGVGSIEFGMTDSQVRSVVGGEFRSFKKTPISETLTDAFSDKGIHVYYRKLGICEAVEFGSPAEPIFMGKNLIGIPFGEIAQEFELLDNSIEIDENGFTSYKYGIGVFVPTLKESMYDLVM